MRMTFEEWFFSNKEKIIDLYNRETDPNYECKLAYAHGKVIQCRTKTLSDSWADCTGEPKWSDVCEYRVKPEPEMWTACIDDKGVVSIMKARDWNKSKGRQLIEGTEKNCEYFATENYCNKCAYKAACFYQKCTMNTDMWYCQGFKELRSEPDKTCSTCRHCDSSTFIDPCDGCQTDMVVHSNASGWEPKNEPAHDAVVHRMTNRELAKWVWQGNGQVKHRDGYYTLIACTAYDIRDDNKPCPDYYVIRGWDETEWSEPIIEE